MSGQNKNKAAEPRRKIGITITGPLASGKTVAMLAIAEMLEDCGYAVNCTAAGHPVRVQRPSLPLDFKFDGDHAVEIRTELPASDTPEIVHAKPAPPENTTQPEIGMLRVKAELLTAVAGVATGKGSLLQAYHATIAAWRDGVLTDGEANGIGKALIAIERER